MRKKKHKPGVADLVAEAIAKGLSVKSTGVNTAALNGTSGLTTNLQGSTAPSAAVNWQRLPPEFLATCSEAEWQSLVRSFAEANGWTCYHTLDSRGSDPGFPDLVIGKQWPKVGRNGATVLFAELKDEGGKLSDEQKLWRDILLNAGYNWYLWRPSMWDVVKQTLSG